LVEAFEWVVVDPSLLCLRWLEGEDDELMRSWTKKLMKKQQSLPLPIDALLIIIRCEISRKERKEKEVNLSRAGRELLSRSSGSGSLLLGFFLNNCFYYSIEVLLITSCY